jgi:hypothetical protein
MTVGPICQYKRSSFSIGSSRSTDVSFGRRPQPLNFEYTLNCRSMRSLGSDVAPASVRHREFERRRRRGIIAFVLLIFLKF